MVTIADYLISRLKELGCHCVFGIPGTSCADFFGALDRNDNIRYILTSNELEAGYMADGYGRQGTLGALCVSYGVGTLSLANAAASALTERVPMVIINGGPTEMNWRNEKEYGVLFPHSTGHGATDVQVFRHLTLEAKAVKKVREVRGSIDRLLSLAITQRGPVYLEVPQDFWVKEIKAPNAPLVITPPNSDPKRLPDFLKRMKARIDKAQRPVAILGAELLRSKLIPDVVKALEKLQMPFVTTLLSKSGCTEQHPLFGGVYDSDLAPKPVRELTENADLVLALGCIFGIDHLTLVRKQHKKMLVVGFGKGRIGGARFSQIALHDVVSHLGTLDGQSNPSSRTTPSKVHPGESFEERRTSLQMRDSSSRRAATWGHEALMGQLGAFVAKAKQDYIVVLDTCLASYPGADLPLKPRQGYLANPVWLSIGQGTPAAAGAYFASQKRPIVVTGDGGFQMVSQTLSTMARYEVPAIVIVIDNHSYAIEQFLIDNKYFTDPTHQPLEYAKLHPWKYEKLPEVFGGVGYRVEDATQFSKALEAAKEQKGPTLIAAALSPHDLPPENWIYLEQQNKSK